MHKKLYKAKKNWVIGLVAGSVLLLGSADGVKADPNLNSTDSQPVSVLSDTNNTDQKWISQKVAKNLPGQYNEQNVRYANPSDEVGYNNIPDSVNSNSNDDTEYEYYSKKNRKIFKGNGTDLIDTYGKPEVYAYNGNDKQLALHPQPYKYVTAKNISSIPSVDNGSYHYLNNGASNAIQFNQDSHSLNYANINEISQYLSCQDYLRLKAEFASPSKEYDLRSLFNDTMNSKGKLEPKRIVKPGEYLTTEELNGLYDAAYDNRPKITFDKEVNGIHITSLLQASVNSIDVSWHLNFENGWHGLTFWEDRKDSQYHGGQLGLADILLPESKNFSWKNTVSRYIFQALKFKKYDGVTGLFGTMALNKNGLPVSSLENNQLCKGNTEVVFLQDGIYAILSSVQQGYAPVLVRLPIAFLKPEYQVFYGNNIETPKTINKNAINPRVNDNAKDISFDQQNEDKEYIEDEILKSANKEFGNSIIDFSGRSNLQEILITDVEKAMNHAVAVSSPISLVETLSQDFLSSIKDYIGQVTASRLLLRRLAILKDAPIALGSMTLQGYDLYKAHKYETATAANSEQRVKNFQEARKAYLDNYKRTMNNEQKGIFDLTGNMALKGVAAVACTAAVATAAVIWFNKMNIDVVSKKTGASIKNRWSKKK